ncbi:hypothetical protein BAUCODRAFT_146875 [Baudoinia panamericana UAMH 10762]|uniref:Uncharacterized protein n=1 Tax=Baudoinia panamericana (strain UAMH 10762) TaxID=717646 RepID=M2NG91_BAUPA|nr:uncharacterized protein BAUCODRAFT_146875 [Baudoinia panamericana UAMH 10762]EMC98324.1 hypothetical protein BAUCODRAFT_146875 [Baudoinia panamericana UAMH 10762]
MVRVRLGLVLVLVLTPWATVVWPVLVAEAGNDVLLLLLWEAGARVLDELELAGGIDCRLLKGTAELVTDEADAEVDAAENGELFDVANAGSLLVGEADALPTRLSDHELHAFDSAHDRCFAFKVVVAVVVQRTLSAPLVDVRSRVYTSSCIWPSLIWITGPVGTPSGPLLMVVRKVVGSRSGNVGLAGPGPSPVTCKLLAVDDVLLFW